MSVRRDFRNNIVELNAEPVYASPGSPAAHAFEMETKSKSREESRNDNDNVINNFDIINKVDNVDNRRPKELKGQVFRRRYDAESPSNNREYEKVFKNVSRSPASCSQRRPWSTPSASRQESSTSDPSNGVDPHCLILHTMKLQDWLSAKNVRTVQEKSDTEARETKKMYNSILDTENNFVKDIDRFLQNKDTTDLRKKEILHKKWNEQVYEPIRKKINRVMSGPAYVELDKRKRELHKEYLEFTNKKGHVFLDTYPPEEYYPMALCPMRPYHPKITVIKKNKVEIQTLADPLLNQARERAAEDRRILHCVTGTSYNDRDIAQVQLPTLPLVPLGRHGTECGTWLAMPLHDIESSAMKASRLRMRGDYNYSQFNLRNWGDMKETKIVDVEMNLPHKRMVIGHPPLSYSDMTKHMHLTPMPGVTDMSIPPQNTNPFYKHSIGVCSS